jgi:hypothetical protein
LPIKTIGNIKPTENLKSGYGDGLSAFWGLLPEGVRSVKCLLGYFEMGSEIANDLLGEAFLVMEDV